MTLAPDFPNPPNILCNSKYKCAHLKLKVYWPFSQDWDERSVLKNKAVRFLGPNICWAEGNYRGLFRHPVIGVGLKQWVVTARACGLMQKSDRLFPPFVTNVWPFVNKCSPSPFQLSALTWRRWSHLHKIITVHNDETHSFAECQRYYKSTNNDLKYFNNIKQTKILILSMW